MSKQEWHIDTAMKRVIAGKQSELSAKRDFHRTSICSDVNSLSECLLRLAHVINNNGDIYLPIFERIKDELDKTQHMTSLKDLAKRLAEQDHHQQGPQ